MNMGFRFDPPLSIPGHGKADMEGVGDPFRDGPPDFVRISVYEESGKRLAHGLFRHVPEKPGLYVLIDGTACTGDASGGIQIADVKK